MKTAKGARLNSRRNVRKSRWKCKFIAATMLLSVLAAALFLMSGRSPFPLREVVFYGNKHLGDEEMRGLMKIKGNEDLLLDIKCSELAERLLRSPWIKTVSIRKEFPDRLLIKVKEAEPFALLDSESKFFIIDETGHRLQELTAGPVQFLPVIHSKGLMNTHTFSNALLLIKAIKETDMLGKQVEITGIEENTENLCMSIDNIMVKLGQGHYHEKLVKFLELEDEIKKRWTDVEFIDLRFANRVIVRPITEVSMKESPEGEVQK